MTDMVERVARAIVTLIPDGFGWEQSEEDWRQVEDIVRAAIEAMREPDSAMVQAGGRTVARLSAGRAIEPYEDDAADAWRAMIDAALIPNTLGDVQGISQGRGE